MLIGSTLGAAVGTIVIPMFPDLGLSPVIFAMVGTTAMLSGSLHAPLFAALIVFEMAGVYEMLVPLMMAAAIGRGLAAPFQSRLRLHVRLRQAGHRSRCRAGSGRRRPRAIEAAPEGTQPRRTRVAATYHLEMTDLDQRTVRAIARAMPKAELHLHLDGSLRIDTALDSPGPARSTPHRPSPACAASSSGPTRSTDQAELLKAFDLPIALMQDAEAIERISADLVEDKARDNVRYAEIRWAPLLHTAKGLTGRQVVEATWQWRPPRGTGRWHRRPVDRDPHALARAGANLAFVATSRRTASPTGWSASTSPGLSSVSRPETPPRGHRPRAGDRAARHRPRGRMGRRGAGAAGRSPIDPERIAHGPLAIDDPALVAELIRRGTLARPVPHLERPGADRADARGPPAAAPDARPASGSRSTPTT